MTYSLFSLILSVLLLAITPPAHAEQFFFSTRTSNTQPGKGTRKKPFRSLSAIRQLDLEPGDSILLEKGSLFREKLVINSSGDQKDPISVTSYGEGANPIVSGGYVLPPFSKWTGPDSFGEFFYAFGTTAEFYTSSPQAVLHQENTQTLLRHGVPGRLKAGEYGTRANNGKRYLFYRPSKEDIRDGSFLEISKRNVAILIEGSWIIVDGIDAVLGNTGHKKFDPPVLDGTIVIRGNNVKLMNATVQFSKGSGIVSFGAYSIVQAVISQFNGSTGISLLTKSSHHSTVRDCVVRYNGNLSFLDADRGGIGVQSDFASILDNTVHNNGNIKDYTGPRIGGDDAITIFRAAHGRIEGNFVANSARTAISSSWHPESHGHVIKNNIIAEWNIMNLSGTNRTAAILVFGHGGRTQGTNIIVEGNKIFSSSTEGDRIGIYAGLPTNQDRLSSSSVINNVIHFANNKENSTGIRVVRPHLFTKVIFSGNKIVGAGTPFSVGEQSPIATEQQFNSKVAPKAVTSQSLQ